MDISTFIEQREVNLDAIFNSEDTKLNANLESFRKLGHNMEKKISMWWDVTTFDKYIKANIVPRCLRWDVPLNDGLTDQESIDEWFRFLMKEE